MRSSLMIGRIKNNICYLIIPCIFNFIQCKSTQYIKPQLPTYEVEEVERPVINNFYNSDGTYNEDIINLIRYAEIKEVQLENFIKFYNKLRDD